MKPHFVILPLCIILGINTKAQQCCTPIIEYASVINISQLPELTKARDIIKTSGVNLTLSNIKTFKAGKSILLQPNTHIKIDPSTPTAYFKAQIEQCSPPVDYKLTFRQLPIIYPTPTTIQFALEITKGNGPFTVIWFGGNGSVDTGYRGQRIIVPRPSQGLPYPDTFPVAVMVIDECYGISKAIDVCSTCSGKMEGLDNYAVTIDNTSKEIFTYNIYPNPTSGNLTIDLNDTPISSGEVLVMNKLMQIVYRKLVSNTKLLSVNLEDLQDDMYFVTISSNGQSSTTKVILKK